MRATTSSQEGGRSRGCDRVRVALRTVGATARKWTGKGECVGWGGLWGVGCGGSDEKELPASGGAIWWRQRREVRQRRAIEQVPS